MINRKSINKNPIEIDGNSITVRGYNKESGFQDSAYDFRNNPVTRVIGVEIAKSHYLTDESDYDYKNKSFKKAYLLTGYDPETQTARGIIIKDKTLLDKINNSVLFKLKATDK